MIAVMNLRVPLNVGELSSKVTENKYKLASRHQNPGHN
jgi:hypothetical protein